MSNATMIHPAKCWSFLYAPLLTAHVAKVRAPPAQLPALAACALKVSLDLGAQQSVASSSGMRPVLIRAIQTRASTAAPASQQNVTGWQTLFAAARPPRLVLILRHDAVHHLQESLQTRKKCLQTQRLGQWSGSLKRSTPPRVFSRTPSEISNRRHRGAF